MRSETTKVRSLAKWKRVRRAAIERDGYRCRACGKAAGQVRGRPHHPTLGGRRTLRFREHFKRSVGPVTSTRLPSTGAVSHMCRMRHGSALSGSCLTCHDVSIILWLSCKTILLCGIITY